MKHQAGKAKQFLDSSQRSGITRVEVIIIVMVLLLGLGAWRVAKRDDSQAAAPGYCVPDVCTPFAVIDLLQRIDADQSRSLAAPHRDQLQGIIRDLERIHFAPDTGQANGHGDLQAIARDWVGKVS